MAKLRLLHLEDSPTDAFLVRNALAEAGIVVEIVHAASRAEFLFRVRDPGVDAILVDSGLPDISSREAIQIARANEVSRPVIVVSNSASPKQVNDMLAAGAADYILKGHWWQLVLALRRTILASAHTSTSGRLSRLVAAVQELSLARDLDGIMAVARRAARELTGADGATFVLRDGDHCLYAEEDAIQPLWKGQRFPMAQCISGWAMENRRPAICEDVENDPRIPLDIYRRTFVKSLVVVPIREDAPIGAIGNYWATRHTPSSEEVELLQTLANTTAVAMESVQIYSELERRVRSRTVQLEAANHELEAFSYSVAHDLRGPLHAVGGYADLIAMKADQSLDPESLEFLREIQGGVVRMTGLIDDLLRLAKIGRAELTPEDVDLSEMAGELLQRLRMKNPERKVEARIQPGLRAWGDAGMLRIVLDNLLSNAWKYSARRGVADITVGGLPPRDGQPVYFVRDNGAGFDPQFMEKLFAPFQRLHRKDEFEGTGIGLATVQRIIHRHGGLIWAEGKVDQGATFFFSLPLREESNR
jgi:signal transduction histidine kinase